MQINDLHAIRGPILQQDEGQRANVPRTHYRHGNTPMTNKGIFVTESKSVNFDYIPIGSVISITSAAFDSFVIKGDDISAKYKPIDLSKAFDNICQKLIDKYQLKNRV